VAATSRAGPHASMTAAGVGSRADRVAVLAPFGRDAAVIGQTLGHVGVATTIVCDVADLTRNVRAGVGAVLVTEESLTPAGVTELLAALADWSRRSPSSPRCSLRWMRGGGSMRFATCSRGNGSHASKPRPRRGSRTSFSRPSPTSCAPR
jgi:hypothetical protein